LRRLDTTRSGQVERLAIALLLSGPGAAVDADRPASPTVVS
jgi:hypothetical protein